MIVYPIVSYRVAVQLTNIMIVYDEIMKCYFYFLLRGKCQNLKSSLDDVGGAIIENFRLEVEILAGQCHDLQHFHPAAVLHSSPVMG